MLRFVVRRLGQAVLTIFGVMVITFLLFRVIAGDIAAAHVGERATEQQRAAWRQKQGYNKPLILNVHRRLLVVDTTGGGKPLFAEDAPGSNIVDALALVLGGGDEGAVDPNHQALRGRYVWGLDRKTPLEELTDGLPLVNPRTWQVHAEGLRAEASTQPSTRPAAQPATRAATTPGPRPRMVLSLADGTSFTVDLGGVETAGDVLERINDHPANGGRVEARISRWDVTDVVESQFFGHLASSVTFSTRSLTTGRKLTEIIAERAPRSLALTVPAMALTWAAALVIASFVAYFRGTAIDKIGVFVSVLGMCIPFLAYMIYGQWLVFETAPQHAYGLQYRVNIFIPVIILVVSGLGVNVRFYRTIILDETHRDYVRTALAKGASLGSVLFRHVLKNCMLPILTRLILAIPFLIMGSLLVETYFGIPGLGDLILSSIASRDEPIISGMVFLTALIYTVGLLLTDLSYAAFDPRVRLQ